MTISKVSKSNRLKLLFLQKQIEEEKCAVCPHYNIPTQKVCEGCHSYQELNNIGNWLLKDTANRKGREVEIVRTGRKTERVIMTPFMLSVNEYFKLKDNGLKDAEIASRINVTFTSFKKWKDEAGLIKTKEVRNKN